MKRWLRGWFSEGGASVDIRSVRGAWTDFYVELGKKFEHDMAGEGSQVKFGTFEQVG